MADVENKPDSSFPVKRKSDLCCQEQDSVANKAQKLNPSSSASADSESRDGEVSVSSVENLISSTVGKFATESSNLLEKADGSLPGDLGEEEEEEDEEEIDRKGKGISREDKGKGKMIEFDESDDSDDDDEEGDEYDESDLSDDPMAEVDLDNILPSRTRRRSIQPGVFISNERGRGNNEDDDDDDDDDSSEDCDA